MVDWYTARESDEEDRKLEWEKVAASLLKNITDGMLKFEEDVCSRYDDAKLPISDFEVGIEVNKN